MSPIVRHRLAVASFAVAVIVSVGFGLALSGGAAGDGGGESSASAPLPAAAAMPDDFLHGITVSCPRAGEIWGTPAMAEAVAEIRRLGYGWIAIHPYAGVGRDGTVRRRPIADGGGDYLHRAAAYAAAGDVELFWKPHLAYWGSFSWRGAIDFGDDAAAWDRFFAGYQEWIVEQAKLAETVGAPVFAVGVELEATTHHEAQWRRIVAAVREVYRGRITYAANWDRLDAVPFWDAVDWIGVQAYFPLADGDLPDAAAIHQGWDRVLADLETRSRALGKPVLFTEIGYDLSADAARRPWEPFHGDLGPRAAAVAALRHRLLAIAQERLPREDWLVGMFWWKWMPGGESAWDRRDRDFSMRGVPAALSR